MHALNATRLGTGVTVVIALAAAVFTSPSWLLTGALVVIAVAVGVVTLAPAIPLLHRLPAVGAHPPPTLYFHLEETGSLDFQCASDEPQHVTLCAGFKNDDRREIEPVYMNLKVIGSTEITRCHQDGSEYPDGGNRMRADSPYWAINRFAINPGSLVMHFDVELPGPGAYRFYLHIWGSPFYKKDGVYYQGEIHALPPEPPEATTETPRVVPSPEATRTEVEATETPAPRDAAAAPDGLKGQLLEELKNGRVLKARLGGGSFRQSLANPWAEPTTKEKIAHWEQRVAYVLDSAGRSDLTTYFLHQMPPLSPQDSALGTAIRFALSDKPLEARIDYRLVRLNTILRGL
ncbi:MAG: hypothetical protein M3141_03630 [Actinomycetota bacterium]|nr:hypothetical protein [Actinomycetota bacterium]